MINEGDLLRRDSFLSGVLNELSPTGFAFEALLAVVDMTIFDCVARLTLRANRHELER